MSLYIKCPKPWWRFLKRTRLAGEQIQVAENDLLDSHAPKQMDGVDYNFWNKMVIHEAMSACAGLGGGWRLPTKEELKTMYEQLHLKGKGNFQNAWYWSSSEDNASTAWHFYFEYGKAYSTYKVSTTQVRAVRTLP